MTLPNDIEEIRKELQFPLDQIEMAVRADFKCEYCGKDLLESADAYDSWQKDHLIPNGDNSSDNMVLSCKTCNFAKRHSGKEELEKCPDRKSRIDLTRK